MASLIDTGAWNEPSVILSTAVDVQAFHPLPLPPCSYPLLPSSAPKTTGWTYSLYFDSLGLSPVVIITVAMPSRDLVTLGLFIIDEFKYLDENGEPTGRSAPPSVRFSLQPSLSSTRTHNSHDFKIGGGGTFAAIGARLWSVPSHLSCNTIVPGVAHPAPSRPYLTVYSDLNIYTGYPQTKWAP